MSENQAQSFTPINRAYNTVFKPERLSIGLVAPIENYGNSATPTMANHLERARQAEALGFSALWLRDVPFNVPSFGDAGQMYDPFVYLGYLAAATDRIALGVSSIILPLRHPAHVAKAAASVDLLSQGRLILGVASGDRPEEYPALHVPFETRGKRFRESFDYIREMSKVHPQFKNDFGHVGGGMDMLPKNESGRIPLLVTGGSQQEPSWIAEHADGWMTYPRNSADQARLISDWQLRVETAKRAPQPVMQPLYVDLLADPAAAAQPIHLGFRSGVNALRDYLESLQRCGVNHVALNLRFNQENIETTLDRLADNLLNDFS